LWDQQILLLWILLTPVFLTCTLLVFAAPLLFPDRHIRRADNDALAEEPSAMTESVERKAA
jgi:hypothetical protein